MSFAPPLPASLSARLAAGDALTAELTPPRGTDASSLVARARDWADAVDAVHVNDCLFATPRMSPLAVAALLQSVELECVLQVTLRHRNRIAIQADLLGAHALGVRGVLVLPGYSLTVGTDPLAREAGDLRSEQAIALTRRLAREGILFDGDALPEPTGFSVGAVANVGAGSLDHQLALLEAKVMAGADWIALQGSEDLETVVAVLDAAAREGLDERAHLVAGLVPFGSLKRLRALDRTPGIVVPRAAWAQMSRRDEQAAGFEWALGLGRVLLDHPATSGLHVRPFGWDEVVVELAAALRPGDDAQPSQSASSSSAPGRT